MEEGMAEEELIDRKLRELEVKKNLLKGKDFASLQDIQAPQDLDLLHHRRREAASRRNSEFLQEVDIEAAKLHMKRLCPLDEKLVELKKKFLQKP